MTVSAFFRLVDRGLRWELAPLLMISAATAAAQTPGLPTGWQVLADYPANPVTVGIDPHPGSDFSFVRMPPGWHITTGPGMILFNPSIIAKDRYRLEAEFFLFPHPSDQPVGIFVGGTGLEGPQDGVSWLGLLIRRDGTAGVIRNQGRQQQVLIPYTRSDSLTPHPGGDSQRVTLAIDVEPDSVRFLVNRARVAAVGRGDALFDGGFGFRVGQALNLHVVRLDYIQKLAPGRGQ